MLGRGRGRGGGGPLGKLISSGVGLAAEAIEHHRAKSKSPRPEGSASQTTSSYPPPPYQPSDGTLAASSSGAYQDGSKGDGREVVTHSDSVTKHDEAVWELDEAARELEATEPSPQTSDLAVIPKGVLKEPARISVLVDAFISVYAPIPYQELDRLPCPVILPQRRPEARDRGFVRAYAPLLESSGIDQSAWMQFLDFYDESLKYSNVIKVVSVAGSIAGLIPSVSAMVVGAVLSAGSAVAGGMQSRQRNNDFISRMNEQWFVPMGMVCMVLKYTPGSQTGDFSLQQATGKATGPVHKNLRNAHGATNEAEMPAAAPLIFPDIDRAAGFQDVEPNEDAAPSQEQKAKLSRLERSKRFIVDYQDRRARAQFAVNNPDSQLAQASKDATKFESSLADPSKNTGVFDIKNEIHSSISEYTGISVRRGRRGVRAGRRAGPVAGTRDNAYDQGAPHEQSTGFGRGRAGLRGNPERAGPLSLVQKVLKKDVLYLMVVPMPSQQEIDQYSTQAPQGVSIADVQL